MAHRARLPALMGEFSVQKLFQGLVMALAVLLGSVHAEAGSVARTADGLVDLSRFGELEKAVIVKTAENQVLVSIKRLPKQTFAGQDGSLKLKKLLAVSFAMLAAEADRAGLAPLAKLNGFKTMTLQDNIRGKISFDKLQVYDEKIEAQKQEYFDELLKRSANTQGSGLSENVIEAHARVIAQDIFAVAKEKILGGK